MALVQAGPAGLDMDNIDLGVLLDGDVRTQTSSVYSLDLGGGDIITFSGVNFSYGSDGYPVGGVVQGVGETYVGQMVFQATGLSIPVPTIVDWAINGADVDPLATALAGSDTLNASDTPGNVLYGLDGNDLLNGGASNDELYGGAGDNTILGNGGNDILDASDSSGSNTLFGGDGQDYIAGGLGFDRVNGNVGADTIIGQSSVGDWLSGGQNDDVIDASASSGNNLINGNMGNDTIYGGSGADTLRGGQNDDVIYAGTGNDWLSGDLGDNTIYGDQGMDTFRAGAGHDHVHGWHAGDQVQVASGVTNTVTQVGADVHITFSNGGEMDLLDVQSTSLQPGWIVSA
jgi:Ca2+-binding RTX toxin-like protein